jgi:RNA polymerase sigma factor (sigma-70 family)
MKTTTTQAAALAARDRIARHYMPEADRLARSMARRLQGLADVDDLKQEARLSLVQAAARIEPGTDPLPYLRRTIAGALRRYVRDRVRLVRVSRRAHEQGGWPLGHASLDIPAREGGPSFLDLLEAPEQEQEAPASDALERELLQKLDQLPAGEAAALRLTVLEGLSLREAGAALGVPRATLHARRARAVAALRSAVEAA